MCIPSNWQLKVIQVLTVYSLSLCMYKSPFWTVNFLLYKKKVSQNSCHFTSSEIGGISTDIFSNKPGHSKYPHARDN